MTTPEQAAREALDPVARLEYVLREYMQGNLPRDDVDSARAAVYAALAAGQAQPVAPAESLEDLRKMLQDEVDRLIAAHPAQPLTDEQRTAIAQWLAFGEQMHKAGHQGGYFSGNGWAAVQLRSVLGIT